jgi:hypothetical protein
MKCNYFRYPKTTNEMRQFYASNDNELGIRIKVRGRRRIKSLPNSWDDIYSKSQRCWKVYRKHQWITPKL